GPRIVLPPRRSSIAGGRDPGGAYGTRSPALTFGAPVRTLTVPGTTLKPSSDAGTLPPRSRSANCRWDEPGTGTTDVIRATTRPSPPSSTAPTSVPVSTRVFTIVATGA